MSWKCYIGTPIEFSGTYQWTSYHGNTMLKFDWTHKPYLIPIGKGFYVEPKLMHTYPPPVPPGLKLKNPSLPSDINLIVTGPGLPKEGKELTLQWASASCLSGASKVFCRQFMVMQTLETLSGPSEFTFEFISGYSEQSFGKDEGNIAFWRVCYDGPFELVHAKLPNWRELELNMTFWWIVNKIGECRDDPDCDVPVRIPKDPVDEAIKDLVGIRVPEDKKGLCQATIERLEHIKAEMDEVESLLKRSNEVSSINERLELRNRAIHHLERAHNLKGEAIKLLSELEERQGRRDREIKRKCEGRDLNP